MCNYFRTMGVLAGLFALVGIPLLRADVVSTFDSDSEQWSIYGDGRNLTWHAEGGNPGGYISIDDIASGNTWYFSAPAKFLGDQSGTYGHELTFDLKQSSTTQQFNNSDVVLIGESLTLVYDTANNPGTAWTSYAVPIIEGDWRTGTLDGPVATREELRAVLAKLTALRIRGEFHTGSDTGSLDNCILYGDPPHERGDMNCDGAVDFNDIDPFIAALISREDYESQYPDCDWFDGDINEDGGVDFNDIDGFVECLVNGGCE